MNICRLCEDSNIEIYDHTTTRPHDHTTTRPHDHTTTRPHDHTTTRPHDHTTIRPYDHTKSYGNVIYHGIAPVSSVARSRDGELEIFIILAHKLFKWRLWRTIYLFTFKRTQYNTFFYFGVIGIFDLLMSHS